MSFIDILALLLTLFVLLLAYESQGPEAGNAPRPLLQQPPPQAETTTACRAAAVQAPLRRPPALFETLSPLLAGGEPSFIELPVANLVSPGRLPAASEPAGRAASQPAPESTPEMGRASSRARSAVRKTLAALSAVHADMAGCRWI